MRLPPSPLSRLESMSAAFNIRSSRLRAMVVVVAAGGISAWAFSSARGSAPVERVPTALVRGTDDLIAQAQTRLRANPGNVTALTDLAGASLVKVRESGDPSWYATAETAARQALAKEPSNPDALDTMGTLALARHRFAEALKWSLASQKAAPSRFAPAGIQADALIELGRYSQGFATVQHRLDLKPDLGSYSRASYARELVGDRTGATTLMGLAVESGRPGGEPRAWARVQVGLLRFGSGDLPGAERELLRAQTERPNDARVLAGIARVRAAQGRLPEAGELVSRAIDLVPLPEYPAFAAEIAAARHNPTGVQQNLSLVRGMDKLLAANGVKTDLDLALIDADWRRPNAAAISRARAAYASRPGVIGDDILGWVLTRGGKCDEGLKYARRSLRLGTRDALVRFHVGMAASCAGQPAEARARLSEALTQNPNFSLRWAPIARQTLRRLEGSK